MNPADRDPPGGPGQDARFEELLVGLSTRFIGLEPGAVDREIEDALRRVCQLVGLDLAVLWQWSREEQSIIAPTHTYYAHGSLPPGEPLQQEQLPWYQQQMLAGCMVCSAAVGLATVMVLTFTSPERVHARSLVPQPDPVSGISLDAIVLPWDASSPSPSFASR